MVWEDLENKRKNKQKQIKKINRAMPPFYF